MTTKGCRVRDGPRWKYRCLEFEYLSRHVFTGEQDLTCVVVQVGFTPEGHLEELLRESGWGFS